MLTGLGDFNEILDEYFWSQLVIDGWDTCCEIALRRMSLDLTDDKLTLVQVMAFLSSGNRPLTEPMLTQFSVVIWLH